MNLHRTGPDWPDRRRVIVDALRADPPDVLAFQEAYFADDYDQTADLAGPGYELFHQVHRRGDATGISLASRWPITRRRELDLRLTPRTRDYEIGALLAEIEAPAPIGPLLFVNAFPSWETDFELEREMQAVALARAVDEFVDSADRHVVIAGDLDADPRAASIRFWTGRQSLDGMSVSYRDAWESANPGVEDERAATFTPSNPSVTVDWPFRRIDYVLVRNVDHGGPSLDVRSCRRIFDAAVDGIWASDHFGIVAELEAPAA